MSRPTRGPRLLAVVAALLAATLLAGGSVVLAATVKSGKAITAVKTVTETTGVAIYAGSSGPSAWTDIAGMSTSITVPSDQRALLAITFSAQNSCHDSDGVSAWCSIRVLVDGTEAAPGSVIFRAAGDGNGVIGTNSMQFVAGPLNAGSHTVTVQFHVDEALSQFTTFQRTLTVFRSRV